MKALSVKQPYAMLIVQGLKTIEVRSWETKHRGDLLICASAAPKNLFWCDTETKENFLMPAGCVLGVVELLDVRPMVKADGKDSVWCYAPGAFAWVLRPKYAVRPHKVAGRLSLFDVDENRLEKLEDGIEDMFDFEPPQGEIKFGKTSRVLEY